MRDILKAKARLVLMFLGPWCTRSKSVFFPRYGVGYLSGGEVKMNLASACSMNVVVRREVCP